MSEMELTDDLTDETRDEAESGEPAARRKIPVGAYVGLTLAVILVACIVALGTGKRPFSNRESSEVEAAVETATATPRATATAQPTPVAAPATATPIPALIVVEGLGTYDAAEALPYVAEYSVSIAGGDHVTVTAAVECAICLWPDGFPLPETVLDRDSPLVFRVGVIPPATLHLSLVANGMPCISWDLSPGNSTEHFAGSCVVAR